MCKVLDELQKYVPTKDCVTMYDVLEGEQQSIEDNDSKQYKVGPIFCYSLSRSAQSVRTSQYIQIMTWQWNDLKDLSLL